MLNYTCPSGAALIDLNGFNALGRDSWTETSTILQGPLGRVYLDEAGISPKGKLGGLAFNDDAGTAGGQSNRLRGRDHDA